MPQLAVYLDEETSVLLERASREAGMSRSAWVRDAILSRLRNRLPESFFAVLGTWEGENDPEEIMKLVRESTRIDERPPLA